MPIYKAKDNQTGKIITFQWNEKTPPTEKDIEEIFAQAQTKSTQQAQPQSTQQKLPWQETLKTEAPVMAGSIGGGLLGGLIGQPTAGTFLGASGAKLADFALKKALGLPGGEVPFSQALTEAAKVGAREAAFEKAPRMVIGLGRKLIAPATKTIIPENKRLAGLVKKEFQPVLTPAEQTKGWVQDIVQTFVKKGVVSGSAWQKFLEKRGEIIKNLADDYVRSFGGLTGKEEVGTSVVDKYLANKKAISESFEELYNKLTPQLEKTETKIVTELVPSPSGFVDATGKPIMVPVRKKIEENVGAKIDLRPLKAFAEARLKSLQAAGKMEPELSGANILKNILKQDDFVNYSNAKELRTTLREMGESFDITGKKGRVVGLARNLEKLTDKQIEKGLSEYNPELAKQWRGINAAYKAAMEKFDSEIIRSFVKYGLPENMGGYGKPELVAKALMKPNNISQIKAFINMAGGINSPAVKNVKSALAAQLVKNATKEFGEGEILSGTKFLNSLNRYDEILDILFSKSQKQMLHDVGKLAKISQESYGTQVGQILIPILQAGALGSAIYNYNDKEKLALSLAFLGSPYVLGKAITNPTIVNYFTRVGKFSPKTPAYSANLTKLTAALYRIYRNEKEYREKELKKENSRRRINYAP